MGIYSRVIFPRLCDWLMSDPKISELRDEALKDVSGDVLEIGFGTGLNLGHYPEYVRRITTIEPSPGMNQRAKRRVAKSGIAVNQVVIGGERLPFEDRSFDCVVSTWTMCSISELSKALSEVYRVLKAGGRFLFIEHGLSGDPKIQKWQRRLNGLQGCLCGGCRLDLDVPAVVRAQPFATVSIDRFEMEKVPRTHGTMYRGVAVK
jgi:SAM-dependent methyltransferase